MAIVDYAPRLGGNRIEIVGSTGAVDRREIVIRQDELARIGPVIGNVLFGHLRVRAQGAADQVEFVHLAAIDSLEGAGPAVTKSLLIYIRHRSQRNHLASGGEAAGGAIGFGKSAEVIVEGMVFFNDEHGVLNRSDVLGRAVIRRVPTLATAGYGQEN